MFTSRLTDYPRLTCQDARAFVWHLIERQLERARESVIYGEV